MRELAAELTRAGASEAEATELAALLERAVQPARFTVEAEQLEQALERSRQRRAPARSRGGRRVLVAFATAVALAVAALLILPLTHAPGVDVKARALSALGGRSTVLHVVEAVKSTYPGTVGESTRDAWLDPSRGRARWIQTVGGDVLAETIVRPGSFERYYDQEGTLVVGASCRSFAAGCAELVDPVSFYRQALRASGAPPIGRTTVAGRRAYLLRIPLQRVRGGVRIDQVVTVDAATFLPIMIEWRERAPGGEEHTVSTISIVTISRVPRSDAPVDAFRRTGPAPVRVVHVRPAGRKLSERTIGLAAARGTGARWLGPSGLREVLELRYERGRAIELRYRRLTLLEYGVAVPPEILAGRLAEAKLLPIAAGLARLYFNRNRVIAVLEGPRRSIAVVGPELDKERLLAALDSLRPL